MMCVIGFARESQIKRVFNVPAMVGSWNLKSFQFHYINVSIFSNLKTPCEILSYYMPIIFTV